MKLLRLLLLIIIPIQLFAQEIQKKQYVTKLTEIPPKIDGVLDDTAWQNANIATDFVMFRPESGKPQPENLKTEVKIAYDNDAIYFGAYLHDDKPEEIPMEFTTRDNFSNSDYFAVVLNPQNDGINQTMFFVASTGSQSDAKVLSNGQEDWNWNAVWYSKVNFVKDGWIVEVKIPYSALRFSNNEVQIWSMNFHRIHQKTQDQYSWNFIPRDKGSIAQYDGLLKGIENIKPPIRLSLSPYASGSIDEYKNKYGYGWNAGMDLKYGINENFTLDATLIPDFGQTAFDDVVLNLSPFEQRYDEKRQFFTEGLDLFSKADFFYTRRVGNSPIGMGNFEIFDNEVVAKDPDKVDMLNAIKLSGRTKDGLGIGVFNAITEKTEATINNINEEGEVIESRYVVTEPLANYNVMVIDKQFNKNSSVTLLNTSVLRKGSFRDANVSALLFELMTKDSKYGLFGGVGMSNIHENHDYVSGYESVFGFGKFSGNHQFEVEFSHRDNQFDKNDLGFQRKNNFVSIESGYSYQIFEPKGIFNNYWIKLWADMDYMYKLDTGTISYNKKPNKFTGADSGIRFRATTKKHLNFGNNFHIGLGKHYDYYEPRVEGRFFKENPFIGFGSWISTDYRKKLALNGHFFLGSKINNPQNYRSISIKPRYRINSHITFQYKFDIEQSINKKGHIDPDPEDSTINENDIIFGNRDVLTIENSFSTKYSFNTKASLGLTVRHYWSVVDYDDNFFLLNYDGLLSNHDYTFNHDINYSLWNFDLNYLWEFAPGSQLSILYRNTVENVLDNPHLNYGNSIKSVFENPLYNNLSVKFIYYLDYNTLKT